VNATTDDAILVNNYFVWNAEGNNFVTHLDLEVREVVLATIRPFELH
jgi:hypothetical protein